MLENQGLKSCVNLKWLSVANNKLQSLKGIEGLSKLTVSTDHFPQFSFVAFYIGVRSCSYFEDTLLATCIFGYEQHLDVEVCVG